MKGAKPRAVVCTQETRSVSMSVSPADIIAKSTRVFTSSLPGEKCKKGDNLNNTANKEEGKLVLWHHLHEGSCRNITVSRDLKKKLKMKIVFHDSVRILTLETGLFR